MSISKNSARDATVSLQSSLAEQEAADWFARLSSDNVSEGDCRAYRAWRDACGDNASAYDRIASIWGAAGDHADTARILEMRVAALAERPERHEAPRWTAIAAAITLVFGATTLWLSEGVPFLSSDTDYASQQIAGQTGSGQVPSGGIGADGLPRGEAALAFRSGYSTRIGEVAEFSLPDGSKITLNTGSEVEVDYTAGNRRLALVKGEAVFTVAKDRNRPFIVNAGNSRVVALGTIFTVRKTNGEARVTLIEGKVRVENDRETEPLRTTRLAPGEQLSILPDQPFAIRKADLSRVASWQDGRLAFEQTPLREVLEEFNRYSLQKHVLGDEQLGNLRVSGTFRIKSSEHFAATLEAGFPVVVRARAGGDVFEVTAAPASDRR